MEHLTTGIEPLVVEMPTVEINGRTYTMRRLGFKDVIFWLKTIRESGARGLKAATDLVDVLRVENEAGKIYQEATEQRVGVVAFTWGAIDSIDVIMSWLASVLQVDAQDFADPNKFPLDSIIDIIEALATHPDLNGFFTKLASVLNDEERSKRILRLFGSVN